MFPVRFLQTLSPIIAGMMFYSNDEILLWRVMLPQIAAIVFKRAILRLAVQVNYPKYLGGQADKIAGTALGLI